MFQLLHNDTQRRRWSRDQPGVAPEGSGTWTHLQDLDLLPQQRLRLGQVLLVDALHRHLPLMFLRTHARGGLLAYTS